MNNKKQKGIAIIMSLILCMVLSMEILPQKVEAATKLDQTMVTISKGGSIKLKLLGTKEKVTWSSSDVRIATVSSSGTIKGKKKGYAMITAKAGTKSYRCQVRVEEPKLGAKYYVTQGKTKVISLTGTSRKITWTSSNKKIATVSAKGVVSAKKKGTVTITAKLKDKAFKTKIYVETPKLSSTQVTLFPGKTTALQLKNTSRKVTWSSSDKKVATVSSKGVVKAVKPGTTIIKAKINDSTYSCKVTINKES